MNGDAEELVIQLWPATIQVSRCGCKALAAQTPRGTSGAS